MAQDRAPVRECWKLQRRLQNTSQQKWGNLIVYGPIFISVWGEMQRAEEVQLSNVQADR